MSRSQIIVQRTDQLSPFAIGVALWESIGRLQGAGALCRRFDVGVDYLTG